MEEKKANTGGILLNWERRRIRAVQKIVDGSKQADVAREFNVTDGAVSQWYSKYLKHGWAGIYHKPKPGRPILFTQEHSKKLYEIISKSPFAWGYETDLWTVAMARDVLHEQTKQYFSKTRVLSELHALGFSFQKPQVRALEKNEKVREWLEEKFPKIYR